MIKKLKLLSLLLFPLSIFINTVLSRYPHFIEKYYSISINKFIVEILSNISGIFPFSIYEITMYLIVISITLFVIYTIYIIISSPNKLKALIKNSLLNILSIISVIYFLFIILWGLNYNRMPLETTLIENYNFKYNKSISSIDKTKEDLANLYEFLIENANETRKLVKSSDGIMKANTDYKGIINRAYLGYENILDLLPNLSGNYSNAKYVMSSKLMCYTGITGIYFPFTGEANVNVAIPDIYIPSTTLHEMAHQRGYGSEDEANFLAYIACINNEDYDFQYSGYILALNYVSSALSKVDYDKLLELNRNISYKVRHDLIDNSEFWSEYQGQVSEISDSVNDTYLKANGVEEGTQSYGKVVDLFLTYYNLWGFK